MTESSVAVLETEALLGPGPGNGDEFMARALGAIARVDACELENYRSQLLRYAQWLLGDRDAAQDAVQDTLLAALHGPATFAGRSSVRTWLFGILRHKVMDAFRQQARAIPLDDDFEDELGEGASFTAEGQWRSAPADWGDPEQTLSRKRFIEVLERCIDRLPKNAARVFTMREILDMDTGAICSAVGISQENCYVLLHRARLALRNWLERDWAGEVQAPSRRGLRACAAQ
jgi:RNA polymerase sigma-70 factor (ECF subfamily)